MSGGGAYDVESGTYGQDTCSFASCGHDTWGIIYLCYGIVGSIDTDFTCSGGDIDSSISRDVGNSRGGGSDNT